MPGNGTEVTAGGIARMAGVGRAAVSNWRRRHADFPRPVGGTEASPTFDLAAVERWLRDQGKLAQVPLRERLWQQTEQDPDGVAAALTRIGSLLLLVRQRPDQWRELARMDDRGLAAALPGILDEVLHARLGPGHPVPVPGPGAASRSLPLLRGAAELAADLGPHRAYEFLLGRHLDDGPRRQYTVTPAELAELMAELTGPAATVHDPACGFGALLYPAAGDGPGAARAVHGQEADPDLAALTALRLALAGGGEVRLHSGDSLRADACPQLRADAVLCHPPFNDRNWGHDDLAYDARWEYGFPPRTESELAWVQHALARLRDGGTAVLLMPPAAAARRSGRRIRADLLRRGALRAVIALPAGAAPPYGIPLHLWVLRRPGGDLPPQHLLLVDAGDLGGPGKASWQQVRTTVLDAWRAFDGHGTVPLRPGVSRVLPVLDLLDDDVDLSPARHLPPAAAGTAPEELRGLRGRLDAALRRTAELAPAPAGAGQPPAARRPLTSVGELARAGALVLRFGAGDAALGGGPPVLTEHDVIAGRPPSGALTGEPDEEPVLLEAGDVVVPVLGRGAVARVAGPPEDGAALGRNLCLLRPSSGALDPWFLAGFLRGAANNRQASSFTTASSRLDVRRLQVPRLPLEEQRRYGERFRALAAFEEALLTVGRLGGQLVQGLVDGLTEGGITPE